MIEFCRNADRTLTGNGNACRKSACNEPIRKAATDTSDKTD